METSIKPEILDEILEFFFQKYPNDSAIESSTLRLNEKEIADIQSLLTSNDFLEFKGRKGYYFHYCLTQKGKDLKDQHLTYNDYLKQQKEINAKLSHLNSLYNEKIVNEAKLSKLKVKTFWWIFFFGLFGGIYSCYSIIEKITQEGTESKINRIMDAKLQDTKPNNKILIQVNDSGIATKKLK